MQVAKLIKNLAALDKSAVCYWKTEQGWMIYLPHCGVGCLANHTVEEHHDGTITVSPSILMNGHDADAATPTSTQRHGHLVWGRWQECSDSSFFEPPSSPS